MDTDLTKGFILGGTSAGANFTSGLSHLAREEGIRPKITGVIFLAGSFCHPDARPAKYIDRILSIDEISDAPGLTRKSIDYFAGKKPYSPLWHYIILKTKTEQKNMALPLQIKDSLHCCLSRTLVLHRRRILLYAVGILDATKHCFSSSY